jgi:histidyl-tRNA synthetase
LVPPDPDFSKGAGTVLFKKEIYVGKKDEKYQKVVNALRAAGIKFDVASSDMNMRGLNRGAGMGSYGESSNSIWTVYVGKKDLEAAESALRAGS